MTIISICGMIGTTKPNPNEKSFIQKTDADKAVYDVDLSLQYLIAPPKETYINMLPLLVDTFAKEHQIIALATASAEKIQKEVLSFEGLDVTKCSFEFIDDTAFEAYFSTVNQLLREHDEVIIDLSHGFRHLPLLTLVSLLVNHLKSPEKIKHILFAQEVIPSKHYKIIDLNEYLDIATIAYALVSFKDNYTIARSIVLRTDRYKPLLEILRDFSQHILSNAIQTLFERELPRQIREKIEELDSDPHVAALKELLSGIRLHLINLEAISKKADYERYYKIGKLLLEKGYLLNAITIINEALPLYIQNILHSKKLLCIPSGTDAYHVTKSMMDFIEKGKRDSTLMSEEIDAYFVCSNKVVFDAFSSLQQKMRQLRNDFAHAYGENAHETITSTLEMLFATFHTLVFEQNLFATIKPSDRTSPPCQYDYTLFELKANTMFLKLFPFVLFKNVFEEKRILKLYQKEIPPQWNIPKNMSEKQHRLIDILYHYFEHKNDPKEARHYMDAFYQDFK
ncbi:TM1812 family CRISPR-associated protein [Sulfurospirillum diekertiae]|uniref:TM1812 family CRISPR-associated protein n=1 Tax=Sulfurospirillum diekertiae TaxID=1854492 RepID=A0AA92FFC3_9BACT|nr:TM1812 family CRISPR-associated protein [Sulfurospirillum diekertiae]QIR75247.1 TM1812 family CRISPR-associated protein [Sulfurospirillum diekertiae]